MPQMAMSGSKKKKTSYMEIKPMWSKMASNAINGHLLICKVVLYIAMHFL